MSPLDQENSFVLALVQAMVGAISSNFRRVSLEPMSGGVRLQFVLGEDSEDDLEEISDIEFEFECLQDTAVMVDTSVIVSSVPLSDTPALRRVVFALRES